MLLVQEFLKTKSFKELAEQHGVYASFSQLGHKWSLNYDQLESKESDLLAQECRGLILSTPAGTNFILHSTIQNGKVCYDDIVPGETVVLACPFFRFFNYGMAAAANVDFADSETVIQTKYDGSLIIVYFDPFDGAWCAATRSSPDANIVMDNGIHTFRSLFEAACDSALGVSFADLTADLDRDVTYCFELMTPYNRIVVAYEQYSIVLLGARNSKSLKEFIVSDFPVPLAQEFKFDKFDDMIAYINSQDPSKMEGVIVRDKNFKRVKIKSVAYVLAHKMKDHISSSPRNCMEAILLEKDDDMLPLLPKEVVSNLLKMKNNLNHMIKRYDEIYQILLNCSNHLNRGDKKTFAVMVTSNHKILWTSPFFQMFDGKASSMKDFIMKNQKNGTWSNIFLDKMLELSN
jgi:hypothetical protein